MLPAGSTTWAPRLTHLASPAQPAIPADGATCVPTWHGSRAVGHPRASVHGRLGDTHLCLPLGQVGNAGQGRGSVQRLGMHARGMAVNPAALAVLQCSPGMLWQRISFRTRCGGCTSDSNMSACCRKIPKAFFRGTPYCKFFRCMQWEMGACSFAYILGLLGLHVCAQDEAQAWLFSAGLGREQGWCCRSCCCWRACACERRRATLGARYTGTRRPWDIRLTRARPADCGCTRRSRFHAVRPTKGCTLPVAVRAAPRSLACGSARSALLLWGRLMVLSTWHFRPGKPSGAHRPTSLLCCSGTGLEGRHQERRAAVLARALCDAGAVELVRRVQFATKVTVVPPVVDQ